MRLLKMSIAIGVSLVTGQASAQPNPAALDLVPLHFPVVRLGLTGAFRPDLPGATTADAAFDGRFGVTGARAETLGLLARIFEVDGVWRPALGQASVGGALLTVGALLFGRRPQVPGNPDLLPPCLFFRVGSCHPESGQWGVAGTVLGFQYDSQGDRGALRVVEAQAVFSPRPAYALNGTWRDFRVLLLLGASLDWFGRGAPEQWVGRLSAGVDAEARLGSAKSTRLSATARFRPSFTSFFTEGTNVGVEAAFTVAWRFRGWGFTAVAPPWEIALQAGYGFWDRPGSAFGLDWLNVGEHTAFLRLVFEPSIGALIPSR